jgi:predicted nucleic acid-binding protein
MVQSCAACDAEVAEIDLYCPECGFPVALTSEATVDVLPASRPAPPGPRTPAAPRRGAERARTRTRRPIDQELQSAAREARYSIQLVQDLGGELAALEDVVPRAAVLDGRGRAPEALRLLRDSQQAAISRAGELFEDHLQKLQKRQVALIVAGFDPGPLQGASRLRAEFTELPLDVVARHLLEEEQLLGRIESLWAELRHRLSAIEAMRRHGIQPEEELRSEDEEASRILGLLARQAFVPSELERALTLTERLVDGYHRGARPRLQGELNAHAEALRMLPPTHPAARHARGLHAEATRQVDEGRIHEALARLESIREALGRIGDAPAAPPAEPSNGHAARVVPAAPAPSEDDSVRLLKRVRDLAQRLKTLPPDHPLTLDAARLMRDIVTAIREDRLPEAKDSLLSLAEVLAAYQSAGGEL